MLADERCEISNQLPRPGPKASEWLTFLRAMFRLAKTELELRSQLLDIVTALCAYASTTAIFRSSV